MAQAIALAPQLWNGALHVWETAVRAADVASKHWAVTPSDCRHAIVFTASTCAGVEPIRYSAGFGPFSLGWGWMLVGWLLGLLSPQLWLLLYALGEHAARLPSLFTAARPPAWHMAAMAALAQAPDGPRRVILQRPCGRRGSGSPHAR